MRHSSIVGHAIEIFSVFRENSAIPADAIIRRFFMERKYLGARDRRSVADLYFGAIKEWRRLDARVADAFPNEPATSARMLAALLLLHGNDPVVVRTSLEELDFPISQDSIVRLADEEAERQRLQKLSYIERLAILYSFPTWFALRVGVEYGMDAVEPIFSSQNGEAPTSIRANTLLTTREMLAGNLLNEGCETIPSEISPDALRLLKRSNVFAYKTFKRGEFEIQDEASQLVAPFADIHKTSIKVLDACAGAGGKTLHFAALMKNRGEVYSTDIDPRKLEALKERAIRSRAQNIRIVMPNQKEKILGEKSEWFDVVLLDVPCTGSGTLRRNPGIKWVLNETMLDELIEKQRMIMEVNAHFVKAGGTLLYATCSLLKEEGELQMEWFIEQHPEFTIETTMRTRPDVDGCDGFFAARLKKS